MLLEEGNHNKSHERWAAFDVPVLQKAMLENPDDPRLPFYLGLTLQAIDRHAEAMEAFQRRIDMGNWHEEVRLHL